MPFERLAFPARIRFGKWSGIWLGAAAWFADQQIVSTPVYARCPLRSEAFVIGVGAVCAAAALLGAWLSCSARRDISLQMASQPEQEGKRGEALDQHAGSAPRKQHSSGISLRTDRFIATVSMLLACIGSLAVVFGTAAGLILQCER